MHFALELRDPGAWPIAVDADFERFIADRKALLDGRLAAVEGKAKDGLLPDVTLDKGVLKIAPIGKSTPLEAEALAARLYATLPRVRITDLDVRGGALDHVPRLLHTFAWNEAEAEEIRAVRVR